MRAEFVQNWNTWGIGLFVGNPWDKRVVCVLSLSFGPWAILVWSK